MKEAEVATPAFPGCPALLLGVWGVASVFYSGHSQQRAGPELVWLQG